MTTEQDIDLLLKEQVANMQMEIPDDCYLKLGDDLQAGDRILISWGGDILDGIEDEGYLFQLPTSEDDPGMLDFFVHIPHPDNSSGKGDAPQVFTHLLSLLQNKLVKSIQLVENE